MEEATKTYYIVSGCHPQFTELEAMTLISYFDSKALI
jgi:hypothetical protein